MEDLADEADIRGFNKKAKAAAKAAGKSAEEIDRMMLFIDGKHCTDVPAVRAYLDDGLLVKMIKNRETEMLTTRINPTPEQEFKDHRMDPCYAYVLLGACAMTLGCHLPEPYVAMLKKVYDQGGLMPDAQRQMKKALFGPDGYQNGVPYDFKSLSLEEQADANGKIPGGNKPNHFGFVGMNVLEPGHLFNTGMTTCKTSAVIKELRSKYNNPDACGECAARQGQDGAALLQCARCKDRRYCSTACQKNHWKVHKKVCQAEKLGLLAD